MADILLDPIPYTGSLPSIPVLRRLKREGRRLTGDEEGKLIQADVMDAWDDEWRRTHP